MATDRNGDGYDPYEYERRERQEEIAKLKTVTGYQGERRSPRNTTREVKENPLVGLLEMMDGGAGVYAQEARGHREFTDSDVIPSGKGKRFGGGSDGPADEVLLALGFKLGEEVPGDPLFRYAKLPPGWKKEPTDHSMWSKIVDEKGRERISVFYKAAFYDRDAFMTLTWRYGVEQEGREDAEGRWIRGYVVDRATGARLFETEWKLYRPKALGGQMDVEAYDAALDNGARAWLRAYAPAALSVTEQWKGA